jgi:hypothetical protein
MDDFYKDSTDSRFLTIIENDGFNFEYKILTTIIGVYSYRWKKYYYLFSIPFLCKILANICPFYKFALFFIKLKPIASLTNLTLH